MDMNQIIQEALIKHTPILSVINEEVLKYMKRPVPYENADKMEYIFDASGIRYTVTIWHDNAKHHIGTYEVEFSVPEQKNSGDRTGKDLKHLNSVLQTVTDIVENEVKDKKIKNIKVEGATGESDVESGESGFFGTPLRARLYDRYLRNRYPAEAISTAGRYINIDMTKVFPEEYKDKSNADKLVDVLLKISDANQDEAGIRRGLYGNDADKDFGIDTDFITSSKHGDIYFVITASEVYNQFDLEWQFLDSGESGDATFGSFQELLSWLKDFEKKANEETGVENLND